MALSMAPPQLARLPLSLLLLGRLAAAGTPVLVTCDTTQGPLDIEVNRQWSPKGADHFLELVQAGWFTDVALFRAVPNFLVQFGINTDQALKQQWGAAIGDDPSAGVPFERGTISYAGSGPNSRTNQLFISYGKNPGLGKSPWETPIGRVTEQSMDVLAQIYTGYGDMPPWGKGPDPALIQRQGNDYVRKNFPKIDFLRSCKITEASSHDL
eukprot:CAMPEP_0171104522 /NCGR_PEP_ID=MMETSP0766_2-20121228/60814_1 /TAXON_ID=439317 /ORGANISM="Gambierdiscus australes, Strain CAWD 149" /LENGTH=210 /DNA_ID=CAMNT_0011565165 /DNA_START=21 /DNA_END=653 /DNA_ORIENTATION=+